jgi:hypothetical protein
MMILYEKIKSKSIDESINHEHQEHLAMLKNQQKQQAELEQQLQQKLQQNQQMQQKLAEQQQKLFQQQLQAEKQRTTNTNNDIRNSTALFDTALAESRLINNSCTNMTRYNSLHFSADNSANTSYMTLNENLFKSPSCNNQMNAAAALATTNNQSLKLLKNIKTLQDKIQNDQLLF